MVFKEFRTQRNLTQAQAGDLFGISGAYWAELESGKGNQRKLKQYGLALSYIDNPQIYNEIDPDAVKKQTAHYRYAEIESITGFSAATWQTLKHNTHLSEKKWRVLVNAALLELAKQSNAIVKTDPLPQEFDHPFSISTIRNHKDENGTLWFCLVDVCKTIDYTTPHHALSIIDADEVQKLHSTDSYNREQELIFISEAGLNEFLCNTTVPKAKPFKKWVYNDVLPSIRKTGAYSVHQAQPEPVYSNMPAWAEVLLQQMGSGMVQMSQDIQNIKASIPRAEEIKTEAVKAVFEGLQSFDGKKDLLKKKVRQIVIISKKLPKIDPMSKYSNFGTVYNELFAFAEPPVSRLDKYTTEPQIDASIKRADLILIRLGGVSQLGFDFEVM